jgi:CheY-like chemotaxis protein
MTEMARIMVVEDDPQNLRLTSIILKSAHHTVVPATNAREAEREVAEKVPDLILLDLGLPDKDGYAVARELRSRPETSRIPILAVSAFAMVGDEQKALEAGCTGYIAKPIVRASLLASVEALLSQGGSGAGDLGESPADRGTA